MQHCELAHHPPKLCVEQGALQRLGFLLRAGRGLPVEEGLEVRERCGRTPLEHRVGEIVEHLAGGAREVLQACPHGRRGLLGLGGEQGDD